MSFITLNLGNIVVGSLVVIVVGYAVRNLIKNFGQCSCKCANCPKEIAKKCNCHIKRCHIKEDCNEENGR